MSYNGLLYKSLAKMADISATEFGFIDGVTAGTSAANKAVVLGATSKINTIDITTLKIGGTSVTATAAELNKLASAGAKVASGTQAAHIANIATDASGTNISVAVNAILAALEAFGITATS